MSNALQKQDSPNTLVNEHDLKNASALLALLHGKSDSICRLFTKEILVGKSELSSLNDAMIRKLSLHNVSTISTSIDIAFINKKVLTFKSWTDFEVYDFDKMNSATKSVFVQWDFFANINSYELPQRHTISVRISSTPNPSDFFKALLNGGFDEAHDLDLQTCTMICKVDFINNTLAEELVNVVEYWNDLCESAYSKKGKFRPFLAKHKGVCAQIFELCFVASIVLLLAIAVKLLIQKNCLSVTKELLLYSLIGFAPGAYYLRALAHTVAKRLHSSFGDLMDTHVLLFPEVI